MNRLAMFVFLACLIPPGTQAQNVQQRAEALLDKARQLSDIRSPNAPAFRLKATFSFIGKNLDSVQGTYTEVWVSRSQWRRETVVNDQRRIEVGGPTRLWVLDNTDDFPESAARVAGVLGIFLPKSTNLVFDSISHHTEMDPPAECAITKPDRRKLKSAFCFDKRDGPLVERILPERPPNNPGNAVDNSCNYHSFQKFGDYRFPREIVCFEDSHRKLDTKVTEISLEPSPDPTLFAPPIGATALGNCSVKPEFPRAASTPGPPRALGAPNARVALSLIIDTGGDPQNVKVVHSAGAHLDEAAINTVRGWQFWPATCDGAPMPMLIEVTVVFPY